MIEREPARLRAGARDDETRTETVNPLHRQTRDDNVNHAYYTPSGPPLVAESHTFKPPACSNYFQLLYQEALMKCQIGHFLIVLHQLQIQGLYLF